MYSQLSCGLPYKREGHLCYGDVFFCGSSSSHFSHGDFLLSDTDSIINYMTNFNTFYMLTVFYREAISNATSSLYSIYQIFIA